MWKILTFLPDLLSGLFTWLNKREDASVEKYKVDGRVDIEAMRQDTRIIEARVELAKAMANDPTTRWGRRLFIYPVGVWFSLIVYDSAFRELLPREFTWRILSLPPNLEYIVYAIVAYLFVTAWKK